jgi:hypothetical protein
MQFTISVNADPVLRKTHYQFIIITLIVLGIKENCICGIYWKSATYLEDLNIEGLNIELSPNIGYKVRISVLTTPI